MNRLVIANRGEIARRILRAARERAFAVAVISTPADSQALVRAEADAVLEVSSFLDVREIVQVAKAWKATLLHPGYGFLSENATFAAAVEAAGITFVGPTPENMRALGGKESAKSFAKRLGVPTLGALLSHELASIPEARWPEELAARGITPPFLIKASGGGGGRGMRIVEDAADLADAIIRASDEALASFNDGTVFIERYLKAPRHIEIQVFGDGKGGGVFLGERECSLQRRHQKVIEESPSSVVDESLREAMGKASLALVAETQYRGAGTVEFLLDEARKFYFLEMNTRLQVEHPVTEIVFGVDLVQAQFDLACGQWPSGLSDPRVFSVPKPRGVALEARILAEDPRNQFLPTPGPLSLYIEPEGSGVRVDSGVAQGGVVNAQFDSMIAKLIVSGTTRAEAVAKLSVALEELAIHGCTTNVPFLQAVARHPDFLHGRESTSWIATHIDALNAPLIGQPLMDFLESAAFRQALAMAIDSHQGLRAFTSENEVTRETSSARIFASLGSGDLRIGSSVEQQPFAIFPTGGHRKQGKGCYVITGPALAAVLLKSGPRGWPESSHEASPSYKKACIEARISAQNVTLPLFASRHSATEMAVSVCGETLLLECPKARTWRGRGGPAAVHSGDIKAPMAGKVLEARIREGDTVEQGQVVFVIESMKMQLEVRTPIGGVVAAVLVNEGQILGGPEILAQVQIVNA